MQDYKNDPEKRKRMMHQLEDQQSQGLPWPELTGPAPATIGLSGLPSSTDSDIDAGYRPGTP